MRASSPTVLVAMVPEASARAVAAELGRAGMTAQAATTRRAALEALGSGGVDVVIAAPAVIDAAAARTSAHTPMVIVLGDPTDAPTVLAALRAGATDVADPADPAAIAAAVTRAREATRPRQALDADEEARFRTLADAMPQLVWMARPDGVVVYYNARRREYQGIALAGDGWHWPVLHPEDRGVTEDAWRKAVETASVYEIEHRVLGADGVYRWHVSRGVPHLDAYGRVRMWYGTATDIDALTQAQSSVARSEERLRLAAESARMFAFEWDPRTDEVRRSAECIPILGEGEQDTGRAFFARVHPDDRETLTGHLRALTPDEPHYHVEYRVMRADGTTVFLEESARAMFDPRGTFIRLVGMTTDVTLRREAERQLRQTSTILHAVAEATPDGIYVKDLDGRFVFANPAALRVIGQPEPQVLGHIETDFYEGDRAEAEAIMATDRRVMATGATETVEELFSAPDGPRILLSTKAPLRDDQSRIIGVIGISSDITARKRAEQALRDSEQRLTIATDAAGLGVFEWDIGQSRALWQNARMAEIFDVGPGEEPLQYPRLLDRLHPDDAASIRRIIGHSPRGGDLRAHLRVRRRTGAWRFIEVSGRFGRLTDGRTRLVGVVADVTTRVEQERERQALLDSEQAARLEAERASLLKDQFLATLSHELRTPLNAVLGWAQLLAMRPIEDRERLTQILQTIARNAQLQVRLIEDLLDMSRIQSGKMRIERRPTSVAAVLRGAVEAVTPAADAKQQTLVVRVEPSSGPELLADPERLQQVVWNVLANAVKFTDPGGSIEVRAGIEAGTLAITVADTGRGIEPAFLPFVFDRFRQADGSTTRAHGGLGLGLSIARHLVELHGGTIEAHSDGVGCGARFRIVLPLAPGYGEPPETGRITQAEPPVELQAARLPAGTRVLIVDDHADARELAATALREHGARPTTAASVDEALSEVGREVFDVLVVDIGMPGRDGYDLIRSVRALSDDVRAATPALALTSFAHDEDRARALEAGFDAHVAKPVSPGLLAAIVGRVLERGIASRRR